MIKNWIFIELMLHSLLVSELSYGSAKIPAKFISVQVCSETIVMGSIVVIIQHVWGGVGNTFNFPLLLVMDFCSFTFLCCRSQQSQALNNKQLDLQKLSTPSGKDHKLTAYFKLLFDFLRGENCLQAQISATSGRQGSAVYILICSNYDKTKLVLKLCCNYGNLHSMYSIKNIKKAPQQERVNIIYY